MPEDHVAIVSRNADGSDAQSHKTVRILDPDAAAEADAAQLANVPEPVVTDDEPEDEGEDE